MISYFDDLINKVVLYLGHGDMFDRSMVRYSDHHLNSWQ